MATDTRPEVRRLKLMLDNLDDMCAEAVELELWAREPERAGRHTLDGVPAGYTVSERARRAVVATSVMHAEARLIEAKAHVAEAFAAFLEEKT